MNTPLSLWFLNKVNSVYGSISDTDPYLRRAESAEQADLIIFEDHTPSFIRNSPEFKQWPQKCVAISSADSPFYYLPGCYSSNSKHILSGKRTFTIPYMRMVREGPNLFIRPAGENYNYLYAFRGGASSWVRKRLFKTIATQNDVFIEQSNHYVHWSIEQSYQDQKAALQKEYADLLDQSLFFLCPRGAGSSSIRLFEVMQAGRVPVIISNSWIPVAGLDWDEFSIRVPEGDIAKLDEIIRANKHKARQLGLKAREVYDKYLAPGPDLKLLADALHEIQRNRNEGKEKVIRFIYPLFEGMVLLKQKIYATAKFLILKALALTGKSFPYELNRPVNEQLSKR